MKTRKKAVGRALLSLFCAALMLAMSVAAASERVSPALDVLENELVLAKCGIVSSDINFTAKDFDDALSVKKVESITILSLPLITSGKLMIGSLEVMKNQTISRSNLNNLTFVPASDEVCETSFTFRGNLKNELSYDVDCALYVLDSLNFAPTAAMVSESCLSLSTVRNIMICGQMRANDPEGDAVAYEISSYPKKGILTVTDAVNGNYSYTPVSGYVGRDSFTYTACDKYGNRSEEVKVSLKVGKCDSDMVYSDMIGHWAHAAAIRMTELGIMRAASASGGNFFSPAGAISRCEFLVMAMKAAGCDNKLSAVDTGFADDSAIPQNYKGYVAAACERGYVSGFESDAGKVFCPNNQITRAEAAVILSNILDAKQPVIRPVFADMSGVPAWAGDALCAMNDLGVLRGTGEGYISPYAVINRAQAAQILYAVSEL